MCLDRHNNVIKSLKWWFSTEHKAALCVVMHNHHFVFTCFIPNTSDIISGFAEREIYYHVVPGYQYTLLFIIN